MLTVGATGELRGLGLLVEVEVARLAPVMLEGPEMQRMMATQRLLGLTGGLVTRIATSVVGVAAAQEVRGKMLVAAVLIHMEWEAMVVKVRT